MSLDEILKQPKLELGHVLDNDQSWKLLDEILFQTARIKALVQIEQGKEYLKKALRHKKVLLLFYQPSTRTRLKFELAAKNLGAETLVINEIAHTSIVKGESWSNTIKTLAQSANVIIIRHPQNFMPHRAARVSERYGTKIINAGDGNNLHPTQTFLDLYTMKEHFGEKFGKEVLNIAIGADPKNARVLHSLVMGLSQYPVRLTIVSWKNSIIQRKYLGKALKNRIEVREVEKLAKGEKFDAIYWIRSQIEHLPQELRRKFQEKYNRDFAVTPEFLKQYLAEDGIFMHPGPRDGEIDDRIDQDMRVKDLLQVENGIYNSMAILKMMLNPKFYIPKPTEV